MVKKFFLLLLVAMLNVVAWAATENVISIGAYDKAQTVGELKFTEPVVRVVTMTDEVETANVTSQYNIEYSIFTAEVGGTEGTEDVVSGTRYMKDTATGTTVKKLGGDVIMGATPGTVWIEVIATPKTSGATLKKRYEINISAVGTDITFTPNFTHKDTYDGSIVVNTKYTGSSYSKAAALLPKYKITQSGTIKDVTDEFDVTLSYSGSSQMYLSSDEKKIQFDQKMSIPSGTHEGVLTYTFTSKTDKYDTFTKRIYVSLNTDGYSDPKKDLTLSLTTSHFKQVNVTQAVGVNEGYPTAHVYKYGQSDLEGSTNNYQYKTPTPSLLVEGTQLPLNVTGGGGSYGDFKLIYQIVKDETYFDDCEFLYSSRAGSVQRPGEPTGLTIGEYMYQVSKPGIVKVAVYAVLDEGSYGTNMKAMYNAVPDPENPSEDWVITDQWGGRYVVFAQPQYFYIEVMKRQPTIQLSPDPTHLQFIQGDVIEMNDRFEISAIKGTDSNGIAGALEFGANDGWSDHFAYQFFISDRNENGHIHIDWNKDWDPTDPEQYGDIYSYRDWRKTGYVESNNEPLQKGDIIKTGNKITFTADADFDIATAGVPGRNLIGQTVTIGDESILVTPGNIATLAGVKSGNEYTVDEYVLITSDNISSYSDHYLQEGDFEKGITYNSMKGYGNEDWKMTFLSDGTYNIPYTVRPWNHVRWDNSAEQTITFAVTGTPEPTEIVLSYYYQVATLGQSSFNEPTAKVVTTKDKYDVTKYFDITYSITDGNGGTLNGVTGLYEHTATGTTINPTTGEVTIGSTATGDVIITVHGARKSSGPASYGNPSDVTYTIHIVSSAGLAQWEVISSCDNLCDLPSDPALRRFATMDEANGRMHFYGVGTIYGGTVIEGVPGIDMTVGVPTGDATTEWTAEETTLNDKICCSHEDGHKSVIVTSSSNVVLDENGIPASGAFYTFKPSVNGFLTVDANFKNNHSVVLRSLNSITGETLDEKFYNETGADVIGDHLFTYPLLAGQTYYLFDETDGRELRLHGFGYQPAFIMDRSTTKAQSEAPLSASTFLNSLMRDIPELYKGSNSNVTFAVSDPSGRAVGGVSAYLEIGGDGALDPKQMTVDGSGVFKLRVTATVSSSTLAGNCTKKTTSYDIQIIDIPTFKIGKYFKSETPAEGTTNYQNLEGMGVGYVAETTNIKTAMQMTFGGYPVGSYQAVRPNGEVATRTDGWLYNNKTSASTTTAGHRIEGHHEGDTWDYDKIIDNFSYFTAGKENPVNEEGNGPLVESPLSPNNGANYTYGNGVDYEQDESFYYNTTYRVPSRGAYLKFEPRESGTLIVYLWMNGSCDYHFEDGTDGYNEDKVLGSIGNSYKLKWRPLYITDETGKPVTMVNKFGNVSKYLDAGDDLENAGSYTLGLARCNKTETTIDNYITGTVGVGSVVLRDGCSFDWSEFRGTDADAARLLAAWPEKGERESIIRLDNGGFAIPHKAYVRFAFDVKAGKTYFLFQQGSKPGFGGYSFVPVGFPDECTYAVTSTPTSYSKNATTKEKLWNRGETSAVVDPENPNPDDDITFTWDKSSTMFNSNVENLYVTINDRRNSEIATDPVLTKRNFTSGKWESLCLPFSVSESEMKDVFGDDYMLVTCDGVYTYKDNSDNKVVTDEILFTRHANGYVEAGRPYLVKPSKDGTFTFKNVSIEGAESVTDYNGVVYRVPNPTRFTVGINNEEFIFKGVYMRETMPRGSYFVYNGDAEHPNGLYRYNADAKIGGYRAYFQLQSGRPEAALMSSFSIRDVKFAEADIETGILAINKDGSVTEIPRNAGIYTIDGQKLSDNPLDFNKLPSGIYIVDGKKYVK